MSELIELQGAAKAERDLHEIAQRLANPEATLRREFPVLEESEAGTFGELGGRYVRTGATLRSLTLPAGPGAIRRVTGDTLEFGTSVGYARYLTERVGPPTAAGGMKRPLPVAVLKLTPTTSRRVAQDVLDHVVGDSGTGGLPQSFVEGML